MAILRTAGKQGGARGVRALVAMWLAAAVCGMTAGGTPALAASGHPFLASLSEASPGTGLAEPDAVAVDQKAGRVFVGDVGSAVVDVYSSTGTYLTRFGGGMLNASAIAVDESNGDVYVADALADAVVVFKPDGSGGYVPLLRWYGEAVGGREFGQVAGVAVDNSSSVSAGDVYVVDRRDLVLKAGVVDVFRPESSGPDEALEGKLVRVLGSGKLQAPNGVAVSRSTGRVLVADSFKGAVYVFDASGSLELKLTGKGSPYGPFNLSGEEPDNVAAIAVDDASGGFYVAETGRHVVSQYGGAGEWEGWITATPAGDLDEPRSVAAAPAGDVYVADAALAVVDRFGPAVVVPSVKTEKAAKSGLTRTSAVLPGTVNDGEKPASYRFQYGDTEALGSETTSQPVSGTGTQSVTATVEGLQAGHSYYYRIAGDNAYGASYGAILRLETRPAVEGLETGPATKVAPEAATLTGSLKREGLVTRYYFQYGASTAYGQQSPLPAGEVPPAAEEKEEIKPRTLQMPVGGLAPNTLYHYRLVAENEYGMTYGEDATFTTPGPPVIVIEPVTGLSQTTVTLNARINPEQSETTYRFRYGGSTGHGEDTAPGSAGSGSTPQAVTAILTGLQVGSTYQYQVIAENAYGETTSSEQAFTTVPSAPVHATWTSDINSSEATLHALINPVGNDTHVYFQYGAERCQPDPSSCTNIPVAPGTDLGEGSTDTPGEARLTGLQPGTTYHFRAIADNILGTTEGPEQEFTTEGKPALFRLPDGRAWEMVTPSDKEGAPVEALTREGGIILGSTNGDALTYVVDGALGEGVEGNRSPEWQQIIATRGPDSWSSQDVATPNSQPQGINPGNPPEYQYFSSDLQTALVEPFGERAELPLAPGVTQATIYLRDDATNTYVPVVSGANTAPGTNFGGKVHFVSATPDLGHIVLRSEVALTGPGSARGLYEWSAGQLQLVSRMPRSQKPATLAELGFFGSVFTHAISNDGSKIIWSSKEENTGRGRLYLRDTSVGETIRLDTATTGIVEPAEASAQFQWASSDGSRVFFTDKQRLTPDSTSEPGQAQEVGKPDLYECDIVELAGRLTCRLHDLTVEPTDKEHAAVQNFIFGADEDGKSVYFVAQGVLASNENGSGQRAQADKNNLYLLHYDGSKWTTTLIATLASQDSPEWEGNRNANTSYLTARVSPNGRYLAFMSAAPITGYDNIDASSAAMGARDEEVFLYDSATASLRCVSCNPSGARPAGVLDTNESGEGLGLLVDRRKIWGELGHEYWLAGNIPGWTAQSLTSAVFQSRYLSDDGRLYFNSPDSLVPAATNGKENVYEYEPSGIGSCQSATGGCISLISNGSSDRESAFIEATPDGSSVFFVTEARLLPQDTDTAFDIYDARECTDESPCLTPPEPAPAGCAETDTCRPVEAARQPPGGPAGTAVFSGPGNTTPPVPSSPKQEARGIKRARPLTRAQKLAASLQRCHKRRPHSKRRRTLCERNAKRRFGTHHRRKHRTRSPKAASKGQTARSRRPGR